MYSEVLARSLKYWGVLSEVLGVLYNTGVYWGVPRGTGAYAGEYSEQLVLARSWTTAVQYRNGSLPVLVSHRFYSPAQPAQGFTRNDLLDKPWSQVSSLLPPGTCIRFNRALGSAFPPFSFLRSSTFMVFSKFTISRFFARKNPYVRPPCTR